MTLTFDQQKRAGYLQDLCNKYGDLKVAISSRNKETGEHRWSKHHSVMECWEMGEKGIWFLAHANHRQILPCELVIDLDDNPTIEKMNAVCNILEEDKLHYQAYFTGSKGYHIHLLNAQWLQYDKRYREAIREQILIKFGADLHKKSEVMIAIENVPHWKTGNLKTLVRGYPA